VSLQLAFCSGESQRESPEELTFCFQILGGATGRAKPKSEHAKRDRPYAGLCEICVAGPKSGNYPGVFTPALAKHSSSFSLIDCISVGVDRAQKNFEPMRKQRTWQRSKLTDVMAKVVIYQAFVGQTASCETIGTHGSRLGLRTEVSRVPTITIGEPFKCQLASWKNLS
jgi:hypothetical protein